MTYYQDGRRPRKKSKFVESPIEEPEFDPKYSVTKQDESEDVLETDEEGAAGVGVAKARKRDANAVSNTQTDQASWLRRMSLLRPLASAMDQPLPMIRQICFVINQEVSAKQGGLVVEIMQRVPSRTGWGPLKKLRINASSLDEFDDPLDRELCATIIGSSGVSEEEFDLGRTLSSRLHAFYRLPRGAQRIILMRLIDSGKCLLKDGQGKYTLLSWDGKEDETGEELPWSLWVAGLKEDENFEAAKAGGDVEESEAEVEAVIEASESASDETDGEVLAGEETDTEEAWPLLDAPGKPITDAPGSLSIDVELRRGEEDVMSITRPCLVLPGVDGLVVYDGKAAPLDDCGAERWVQQFRDEVEFDAVNGGASHMTIPKEDIPRFLDRLYMMPHLPHIDLPASVSRSEKEIRPERHIEIYSPTKQGSGSTLSARVLFSYHNIRVKPSQPGEFITIGVASTTVLDEVQDESEEVVKPALTEIADAGVSDLMQPSGDENATSLLIRRDKSFERQSILNLYSLGFRTQTTGGQEVLQFPVRMMAQAVSHLISSGWNVSADQNVVVRPGPPSLSVASGEDWFELRGSVKYQREDGTAQEITLPQILQAVRSGKTMVTLDDGSQGLLPEEWLRDHSLLATVAQMEDDHLRFKSSQAAILDSMLSKQENVEVDDHFKQAIEQLSNFEGIEPVEPVPSFQGKLRSYQKDALGWFKFLQTFGMNGILADDMGLGKTVQVLAMLEERYVAYRESGEGHKPTMVVAPRSVVFNWLDEAETFAPDLRILSYSGADRHALREQFKDHDLIITSFGLLRRDIHELGDVDFDYVILDEAQAIKNPNSQSAKSVRLLQANHRLALTGTPIENHLGDLWSLFEFLNPGMLGSNAGFAETLRMLTGDTGGDGNSKSNQVVEEIPGLPDMPMFMASPGAGALPGVEGPRATLSVQANAATRVAKALRPFILRRTKREVLKDLPDKTEQSIVCYMEPAQRKIYDDLKAHYRNQLLGKGNDKVVGGKGTMMVLEALLRLRQAACHPGLIDSAHANEPSAKLDVLIERVADLIEEGHKALVFSQFTSMLGLVKKRLDDRGIKYEYLDGQTRDRKACVDRFQNDEKCPLFLISLKAGGLGLNLTAADYVFILDPWWNPAVESQAIDRAYRIGQKNHVFAYRLICEDTVEQRIAQMQEKKRKLADAIVGGQDNLLKSLTRDDLEQLLS